MSDKEEDNKVNPAPPPESTTKKKSEDTAAVDLQSAASVSQKIRRFNRTGEGGTTSSSTADMESWHDLDLLLRTRVLQVTNVVESLEKAASAGDSDPRNLRKQQRYCRKEMEDLRARHRKRIQELERKGDGEEEIKRHRDLLAELEQKFVEVEELVQAVFHPTTAADTATEKDNDGSSGTSTRSTTPIPEQQMAEVAQTALDQALFDLEGVLGATTVDPEAVEEQRDMVAFVYAEFERDHSHYRDYLRGEKRVDELNWETKEAQRLYKWKLQLERQARTHLLKQPPTHASPSVVHYGGPHDYDDQKDLPKLANSVKEWLPFWAHFKDVDSDRRFTDLQKFRKLVKATKEGSEARDIANNYAMSSSNYKLALAHLKETYGKKNVLIKVYVRELLQLGIDRSLGKQLEFRKLVNEVTAQIRNLEMLGVTKNECAQILYPVLETCLPKHTLQAWQRDPHYGDDLEKLLQFLRVEVDHENERRLAHFSFQEQKPKESRKFGGRHPRDGEKKTKGSAPTATSFHNGEASSTCIFCENRHPSSECKKALKMTFQEKQEKIKGIGACFGCLEKGHLSKNCKERAQIKCGTCGRNHQTVLCPTLQQPRNESSSNDNRFLIQSATHDSLPPPPTDNRADVSPRSRRSSGLPATTNNFSYGADSGEVPLRMLLVTVMGAGGRRKIVRAMLDCGSQKTCVTSSLAIELGMENVGTEFVRHQLFGGILTDPQQHQRVQFMIAGPRGEFPRTVVGSCHDRISRPVSTSPSGDWRLAFRKLGVELPHFNYHHSNVEVLIGNNITQLFTGNEVELGNGIVAEQTVWGWTLCGEELAIQQQQSHENMSLLHITTTFANSSISALWDLDLIGIRDEPSTQSKVELSKETEAHFLRNVTRAHDGRYEVKLPFLTGAMATLPSNFYAAERRLKQTTDKIRKLHMLQQYDSLFRQWEADKMIEQVDIDSEENWKEKGHYLPHRAVVKPSSSTTPIRPVFDASAKTKGKPSLNQCLDAGPNYLELIPSILTRFRLRRIGVTSDIKKAFQQISIAPVHRPFLRFLWWEDIYTREKLKVLQHSRVPFGVSSSPFLLAATLQRHLDQSPASHEKSAVMLQKSLYVDNCLGSLSSLQEAEFFKQQCQEILEPAQFDLRGWEIGPNGEDKKVPVLGMIWDMGGDVLKFDVGGIKEKLEHPPTQRNVLALAHSLYDPLGILSPFILIAKFILRQCHEEKQGWDKPLPAHMATEVRKWSQQIPLLQELTFPRYVNLDNSSINSLHVFSDASGEAYAAAVFLRSETPNGITVSLIQSKARIATKAMKITIPRLELIGCLIGVRLAATVMEDIEEDLPTTYYTDSSTALAWIQGEGPWGIFVNNRVQEIREKTDMEQWRHVRGKDNPADLPSRGCSSRKLLESEWWMGPSWLYGPESEWPISTTIAPEKEEIEKEMRKTVAVNVATTAPPHPLENFLCVSSYPKILRLASYWLRYRETLRKRIHHPAPSRIIINQPIDISQIPPPTLSECELAEKFILQFAQQDLEKAHLRKLRPVMSGGLLRTSTPIMFDESESFTHPIILPDKNEFVMRKLRDIHQQNCHIGTQLLLAKIREDFWLINGRRTCRKVVTGCWICRRFKAKRLTVPEAPLPRARTATGVPFNVIGVDMAGPLFTKEGRKVWVALFTCATYRAIHLEVVDSMSTEDFLAAFRAFTARRGKPSIVISDNGLNFVGANAALQKVYRKEVETFALEKKIEWRFLPPSAPWWGGFYEKLIDLMKQLLRRILEKKVVKRRELVGLLMEVEEACNNRPLTYLSESPDDPVPLTPNLMIRNCGLSYFPELDIRDAAGARAAVKKIQRLREALRSRFRREYLGALQLRRPDGVFQPLKPGDVVLLEQDNEKKVNWPLGIIVGVIMGRDGFPREYRVKCKWGIVQRAAQRLFPMELAEEVGRTVQPTNNDNDNNQEED